MLNFKDYRRFLHGKPKNTEKNFYLTKDSYGLPLWVIEPPDSIQYSNDEDESKPDPVPEVVSDDPPKMTTPEVVSDYISDKYSRRR